MSQVDPASGTIPQREQSSAVEPLTLQHFVEYDTPCEDLIYVAPCFHWFDYRLFKRQYETPNVPYDTTLCPVCRGKIESTAAYGTPNTDAADALPEWMTTESNTEILVYYTNTLDVMMRRQARVHMLMFLLENL
jgi:hypothetical protein